jgi:putative oxidoreductase
MHPVGPVVAMAPMFGAATTAHKGKPIWATAGGAELPVVNIAALTALTLTGPGVFSFDTVLRTSLGWRGTMLLLAGVSSGLIQAMHKEPQEIVEDARSTATQLVSTVREQIAA